MLWHENAEMKGLGPFEHELPITFCLSRVEKKEYRRIISDCAFHVTLSTFSFLQRTLIDATSFST